jgi:hypothetical protein
MPPFDAMEYIWERLPKEKDGQTVRYLKGDIGYLYYNGFVDTKRFTYATWKDAFNPFQQGDGAYLLSKAQFLSLRIYRLQGTLTEPFDPYRLAEGPWANSRLKDLYDKAIRPSSEVKEEIFWNSVTALKKMGLVTANDELIVNEKVKKQIAYLIERFPSARRRLEKEVVRLRQEKDKVLSNAMRNRDASGFSIGISESEHKMEQFSKLQASQLEPEKKAPVDEVDYDDDEGIDIKSLRKPSGKFRG